MRFIRREALTLEVIRRIIVRAAQRGAMKGQRDMSRRTIIPPGEQRPISPTETVTNSTGVPVTVEHPAYSEYPFGQAGRGWS